MEHAITYTAFAGVRRVAEGALRDVLPILKQRFDRDHSESVLVFEVETGRQIDFDLRGSLEAILEREIPTAVRGPGRPRLGVTSREISLLPRHWDWLERQSSGISSVVRKLVEQASRDNPGPERARRIRAALSPVLSALAGDRPNFEEACRALFAGDTARFEALIARWPKDVRDFVSHQANEAARMDKEPPLEMSPSATVVSDLYRIVWSDGDYGAIDRLVAPTYGIHSDPGDAWEGKSLDRSHYQDRVRYSRNAFPDLQFTVHDLVAAGNRVAARWSAEGTQRGDLQGLPATGKRLTFSGQTTYEMKDGQVAGHWQIVDRLGFIQQIR